MIHMLNISNFFGSIHLCGMMIQNLYGFFIFKHTAMDKLYVISFLIVPLSWILFKDECIVSYMIKKIQNSKYILGSEPDNVEDISSLFANQRQYLLFFNANVFLRVGSVLIVNRRTTHVDIFVLYPMFLLYVFYNYDITYRLNYRKLVYPYFQITFTFYLISAIYETTLC